MFMVRFVNVWILLGRRCLGIEPWIILCECVSLYDKPTIGDTGRNVQTKGDNTQQQAS